MKLIKTIINKTIKPFIPKSVRSHIRAIRWLKGKYKNISWGTILLKAKVYSPSSEMEIEDDYVRQAGLIFPDIDFSIDDFYIYPYDSLKMRILPQGIINLASITPDYGIILHSDINNISSLLSNSESSFSNRERLLITHIESLAERIHSKLENYKENDCRQAQLYEYFGNLLITNPDSLDKAIQKLLFYNALLWQMWHWHNGLGRLDLILYEYYAKDVQNGKIDRNAAKELILQLCKTLGKDTISKSLSLWGDTGQYILLGGVDSKGNTVQNDLTEIFLEVFAENSMPDPKLILRVNRETSGDIWTKAIKSILTGSGSPLLMNEKVIMDGMVDFGYGKEDVWNVGTSACWEPLIIGKSFDQNNALSNVPVILSLNKFVGSSREYKSFDDFLDNYKPILKEQLMSNIHDIHFDASPLFSLFFDDCIERERDFSCGGAKYSYHGVQIVSFPNLINALLNIKEIVFLHHYYTLKELSLAIENNFNGHEDIKELLASNSYKFGSTNTEVVALVSEMMSFISDVVSTVRVNGERVKVGFSSSAYIEQAKNIGASLDGRYAGEPFAVHISPVSQSIDIQEVIDFAGMLDYKGNRLNGNVVDFILPTSYIRNPNKLVDILKSAVTRGVFELQLNILDANTLRDAKAHPEKYPNLIVRVWGFSAYFNDLPEEYKDNLIRRAEAYDAA